MIDDSLKLQLQQVLTLLRKPIRLFASLDDSSASDQTRALLNMVVEEGGSRVSLDTGGNAARKPSFIVAGEHDSDGVCFAGAPLGHEFTSFVLAMLWAGGHPPKVDQTLIDTVAAIDQTLDFEVFMSLTCHNCPDVVQALSLMATVNPRIRTTVIEGGTFRDEVEARSVMAVPTVFLNGEPFGSGRMTLEEILSRLKPESASEAAGALSSREPYDILIVGGGPAGAAAAVYAARKGLRVGVAAERFGGQVNDTLGIENYISVLKTEGPRFAAELQAHAKAYDVDIMIRQRAIRLSPALSPGGLIGVGLEDGGTLRAKAVILATGARWRNVDVPGEQEYRHRGVAYCPHCDGPLFKGKRVAVIGGGNSGVEAAIDLAGIAGHVTVIEVAERLKADAVLVGKLQSLPNVSVRPSEQVTEIVGTRGRVSGLYLRHRANGMVSSLDLEGVFIQIGLVPNTEWLDGVIDLNQHGEVIIDHAGQTNLPGVFAAGDCTTAPYKQIIVAAGEGAKAALGAFDYLIRQPVPQMAEALAA